jgi:hypothetical protein
MTFGGALGGGGGGRVEMLLLTKAKQGQVIDLVHSL